MTPEQQQLIAILDFAFPITQEHRSCRQKLEKVRAQRMKLTEYIEAYRQGTSFNNSPLLISIDLDKIRMMLHN